MQLARLLRRLVLPKQKTNLTVEVEVETLEQFKEALATEADIIMLDNMSNELMALCVKLNNKQKRLEASGNMSLERVKSVAALGVDFISVGNNRSSDVSPVKVSSFKTVNQNFRSCYICCKRNIMYVAQS